MSGLSEAPGDPGVREAPPGKGAPPQGAGAPGGPAAPGQGDPPDTAKGAAPAQREPSFFDHLAELRGRIIKSLLSLLPAMLVCYELSGPILSFLLKPLISLMPDGSNVIATGLAETFLIHVKISLWAGLIVSSPFWLYQIWAFVAPGLYQGERRAIGRLTAMTVGLLLGGAAFAYYVVLPLGFKFFLSFGGGEITILPVVHEYLSLVMTLLLSFGLSFELPLLLVFLASVGIVDSRKLGRFRPYSVVIIVTLAAFLTPPDVVSQILMSIPMLFLYELSVFLIRRRERAMGYEPGGEGGGGGGEPGEGDPRAKARRLRLEAKEAKKKAKEEKKRSAAEAKEAKKKAAAEAKEAKKKAEEAKPQERPEAKGPGPEGKGRDGQANEP